MSTDTHPSTIVSPRPQQHQNIFPTHSSYFLPPTPPPPPSPTTPSSRRTSPKRPTIISPSAAMNWLSHKSSNSIASLRTRTSSLNKDHPSPSIQTLKISDPIPIGPDELGTVHTVRPKHVQQQASVSRPLGYGAEVVSSAVDALDRPTLMTSPPPRRAGPGSGDLPPIPQSPPSAGPNSVIVGLRSSKSSPHLKSPTSMFSHQLHHHSRTPSEYSVTSNGLRSPPPVRSSGFTRPGQ
ncbi:hypothetical protein FRB90_009477, partial [Tulasnella sp. 427]